MFSKSGKEVTEYFKRGADEVQRLARLYKCEYAILKERSPSCGYGRIYDGNFTGRLINGNGVFVDRLAAAGINIIGESRISELF